MLPYRLLITLLWFPVALILVIRVLRGRETWQDWRERIGWAIPHLSGRRLWVHAASNGELMSVKPLLDRLRVSNPELGLLITTNSTTARALAREWGISGLHARLAPLDTRWAAQRILNRANVAAFMIVESEFWPNRIAAASARDIPILVLGARLSRRSARTWRRMAGLAADLQSRISYLSPQDHGSRRRFLRFGAKTSQMGPVLDLKSLYTAPNVAVSRAKPPFGFDPASTWLAASTHPGEDEIVLAAHRSLLRVWPELQLVIAPRHPDRGPEIVRMARMEGLQAALRSDGAEPRAGIVYVADTLGEMPLWYALASICFVGGSLAPNGGHTPFEPAAFGCAVLHGPHVRNFQRIYQRLDTCGGAIRVEDADAVHKAVYHLQSPERRDDILHKARSAFETPDALDDVLGRLRAYLTLDTP